ncbi:hypothetical protein P154DRAFT_145829 [Amniculicola lignicola CBS 123094]|uniref:Uncharacterized protein n=1 Tax=Amniculicola lignicola CBS 123094 TaxID=1392246 RepID=A0A6A5WMV5_9PLEO|nr:hypothetical protein P154DRAFT_145829 [Amniculicola lignicola CBS 123094]
MPSQGSYGSGICTHIQQISHSSPAANHDAALLQRVLISARRGSPHHIAVSVGPQQFAHAMSFPAVQTCERTASTYCPPVLSTSSAFGRSIFPMTFLHSSDFCHAMRGLGSHPRIALGSVPRPCLSQAALVSDWVGLLNNSPTPMTSSIDIYPLHPHALSLRYLASADTTVFQAAALLCTVPRLQVRGFWTLRLKSQWPLIAVMVARCPS